jgi:sugar O-acyltransferase (sialic acid O-acetyltransferase NeuD family)
MTNSRYIFWGGTGQSIVLEEIVRQKGNQLVAIFDNNSSLQSPFNNIPLHYGEIGFNNWLKNLQFHISDFCFMVAIGGEHGKIRLNLHYYLKSKGLKPSSLIHKYSNLSDSVELSEGSQILMGATICSRVRVGVSCIINTNSSIDHECQLGDGVHIGPGATLAGNIIVGNYSFIGAGSVILPNLVIGSNCIIGAGSVVTKNIPDNYICLGNPARLIKMRYN